MPNQGGSHEQHVKAGQQSHKNDDKKQASTPRTDESRSGGSSGDRSKSGSGLDGDKRGRENRDDDRKR